MRNKSIYLLLACVCGTAAAIIASQWLNAQASSNERDLTEIFVASVTIDIGEEITPDRIRLEQWPTDKIPEGATGNLEQLEDKFAKQRFYVGEAIMPVKLMDENWKTVPKGYRVVAMRASNSTIANLVQPGDRVDVMAYFKKSKLIPRNVTQNVLKGVRVYALDGDTERRAGEDRPKNIRNIQILVHEKDAEAWQYAKQLGTITLSLGSDEDDSNADGSNETGQEFLAWLEEHHQRQEDEARREQERNVKTTTQPVMMDSPDMPAKEGFPMIKMVEGRMMKYWIVPGELPVLVGEVGRAPTASDADSLGSDSAGPSTEDGSDDEYGFLNGEESPFFEAPVDREAR